MSFAKLNKPPSLLSFPSKVLEKKKPRGGLNRGFTVTNCTNPNYSLHGSVRLHTSSLQFVLCIYGSPNGYDIYPFTKLSILETIHEDALLQSFTCERKCLQSTTVNCRLQVPHPLPSHVNLSTCRRKPPPPTPDIPPPPPTLACTEINSIYYDVKLMQDIFWLALLLLVCTWCHFGHVGAQEHKHFFSLWTKPYFHVNSSRKKILLFWPQHGRPITWLQTKNGLFRTAFSISVISLLGYISPSVYKPCYNSLRRCIHCKLRAYTRHFTVFCSL